MLKGIYGFFGCQVHQMKCIRNHFMKYKECLYNGSSINFNYYHQLFITDDNECKGGKKVVPKLSPSHIDPKFYQKMNVKLAVQLFSRSVARGLNFYREKGHPQFKNSEETEKFTLDLNNIFDCLNSKLPLVGLRKNTKNHMLL